MNLTQIEADRDVTVTVTIMNPLEGSGLSVSTSLLTFSSSSREPQFITVETTIDNTYTGDRSARLTLTADNYATETVTITILENTPQPVRLMVGTTELNLVRFASTEITVSVDVATNLTVKAEGAVRLVNGSISVSSVSFDLGAMESARIQIRGERIGEGTVTFTVSGERKETATEVVTVTVSKPTLMISASTNELTIEADQTTAGLTVTVSAADQDDLTGVTLTAMINIDDESVASVTPTMIPGVEANVPEIFIVKGLATVTGATTLTLMASHPDYISADTTITVNVIRPVDALRFRVKVFLEGAQ